MVPYFSCRMEDSGPGRVAATLALGVSCCVVWEVKPHVGPKVTHEGSKSPDKVNVAASTPREDLTFFPAAGGCCIPNAEEPLALLLQPQGDHSCPMSSIPPRQGPVPLKTVPGTQSHHPSTAVVRRTWMTLMSSLQLSKKQGSKETNPDPS